jgi:ketosteroid isomerase-like protein
MATACIPQAETLEESKMPVSLETAQTERDPVTVAKMCYQAYVEKDRSAIEALIADEFRFTSPLDNHIDRKTYFERCWPNCERIADFKFIHAVQDGDRAFVTYEGRSNRGPGFRNTEILTVQHGKLVDVEVYFGWSLPHEVPLGRFKNPATEA